MFYCDLVGTDLEYHGIERSGCYVRWVIQHHSSDIFAPSPCTRSPQVWCSVSYCPRHPTLHLRHCRYCKTGEGWQIIYGTLQMEYDPSLWLTQRQRVMGHEAVLITQDRVSSSLSDIYRKEVPLSTHIPRECTLISQKSVQYGREILFFLLQNAAFPDILYRI